MLVNVRQLRVVPVPVAFGVEPVLSLVVGVGSLVKPPTVWEQRLNLVKTHRQYGYDNQM